MRTTGEASASAVAMADATGSVPSHSTSFAGGGVTHGCVFHHLPSHGLACLCSPARTVTADARDSAGCFVSHAYAARAFTSAGSYVSRKANVVYCFACGV